MCQRGSLLFLSTLTLLVDKFVSLCIIYVQREVGFVTIGIIRKARFCFGRHLAFILQPQSWNYLWYLLLSHLNDHTGPIQLYKTLMSILTYSFYRIVIIVDRISHFYLPLRSLGYLVWISSWFHHHLLLLLLLLHKLHLSLLHLLHLLWIEVALINLAWQMMSSEQNIDVVCIEDSLQVVLHGVDLCMV